MSAFTIKTASRAVLRRSQQPLQWHPRLHPKRNHHSKSPRSSPHSSPPSSTPTTTPPPLPPPPPTIIPVPTTVAALPIWQRLGPLSRFITAYARSQRTRPYLTQFYSSLFIYFLGDMGAQSLSGEAYDPLRTLRTLAIGAGSSIPSYKWFMFLAAHFNYPSRLLSLSTKVVVNQLAFAPVFNSYFFGMQSLLTGDDLAAVWARIRHTVPVSFVNSCKLWPAVTAFSFTFIDAQYRSIFAGFVAIGWQTYLSFLNRRAEKAERRERAGEQMIEGDPQDGEVLHVTS